MKARGTQCGGEGRHVAPVGENRREVREHSHRDERYPGHAEVAADADHEQRVGDEPEHDSGAIGRAPGESREGERDDLERDRHVEHHWPSDVEIGEPAPAPAEERGNRETGQQRPRERH